MLLKDYSYRLINISCLPNSSDLNVLVDLQQDISEIFPYLNATIRRGNYSAQGNLFDFMFKKHIVTMEPKLIKITLINNEDEAKTMVDYVVELINGTWDKRDKITPIHDFVAPLKPLDVLQHLPKTNCRACGEPTCMTFALKLVTEAVTPADCPELDKPEFAEQKQRLLNTIGARGPVEE